MNKIRNYWKNKKGITLVWGAFFLVLCLMFLGLAVDIAYMYVVKNQLQVAADSSSLAGAEKLDSIITSPPNFGQLSARQEAWKFACKNTAGNSSDANPLRNVFLVSNKPISSMADCDTAPTGGLNETDNSPDNDIVLGHWYLSTSTFEPATPSTTHSINAIKTSPRRTEESRSYGMPPVSVFVGQIFRILGPGSGWSLMSARASAIAYRPPERPTLPIAIDPACGGISCPGPSTSTFVPDGTNNSGWTGYYNNNANANLIRDEISDPTKNPNVCARSLDPIAIVNGQVDSAMMELSNDYTSWPSCTTSSGPGHLATVPMIDTQGTCKFNQSIPVVGLIDLCITSVVATGSPKTITASVVNCYTCDDAPLGPPKDTKLVR